MPLRPKHHHRAVFYTNPGDEAVPPDEKGVGFTKCMHKRPWSASLYLIPNEMIAARIGQFIGLPVPPFAVSYTADNRPWFSSLYFNFDEEELPPILADRLWARLPHLTAGVIVLDVLIANSDRHHANLVVDNQATPTALRVFDHDQCLFSCVHCANGIPRLDDAEKRLGITDATGGSENILAAVIDDSTKLNRWINRVHDIPEWFIKNCIAEASPYGMSKDEGKRLLEFLIYRKTKITELFLDNKESFPSISKWRLSERLM